MTSYPTRTVIKKQNYQSTYDEFEWQIPDIYNIGVAVSDAWAERDPNRIALIMDNDDGSVDNYTFSDLSKRSNKLANALIEQGIQSGDRVAILLPQSLETVLAHIATYKIGAIAVPLANLFGSDALEYRLKDSGAKCLITNNEGLKKIASIATQLSQLNHIVLADETDLKASQNILSIKDILKRHSDKFEPVITKADDPALIIYTSGTTGSPKGALHAHRVIIGHLPGVEMHHDFLPQPGDKLWTPADWAWAGGLLNVLLSGLHHGVSVVGKRIDKFEGDHAFALMEKHRIRNVFLPPTALKIMRRVPNPTDAYQLDVRSIGSGGEALGAELISWGREVFGLTINEFYGQTEANLVLSSCHTLFDANPGVTGKPVPGHIVDVINQQGEICGHGDIGQIAVKSPDPVMFLSYWNHEQATLDKFIGNWMTTGDSGFRDEEGWIHFVGRDDDLITSSGYRIGPGEIEDCLIQHPAVTLAGVVGKPDPERTELIVAFVMLQSDVTPSDTLISELQKWVKTRLAAHEYPREIHFIDKMPMTTTGKIIRKNLRMMLSD